MTTPLVDLTAEKAVLGAMMLTPEALDRGLEVLDPIDFFHPKHQAVFAAIASLEQQGAAVDAVTVASRLNETGTPTEFAELAAYTHGTPAAVAINTYTKTVAERSLARKLATGTNETLSALHEGAVDGPAAANQLAEMAYTLELGEASQRCLSVADISKKHLDELFEELLNADNIIGHRTGFTDLDNLLGGLRPGTLTVIGARPSMGKSALGLAFAHHQAAEHDNPVLLASLEMTHVELYGRLLASQAKVNLRKRPMSKTEQVKLSNADAALQHVPLNIDATSSLSLAELRAKARNPPNRSRRTLPRPQSPSRRPRLRRRRTRPTLTLPRIPTRQTPHAVRPPRIRSNRTRRRQRHLHLPRRRLRPPKRRQRHSRTPRPQSPQRPNRNHQTRLAPPHHHIRQRHQPHPIIHAPTHRDFVVIE